eukprot:TRINITY_DN816_c0_g2_i1.p1 TRINITY_DN816_c0_g2~~TRINITY_DN816_c0_g2_i1.p1  ORF type:complete len:640 (+),score=180.38 TRINITY_DN816_c0_g2_i1:42-1961(+)
MQVLFFIVLALSCYLTPVAGSCTASLLHRSLDGSCNNLLHPTWGAENNFFAVGPEGREVYPWIQVPQVRPLPTYAEAHTLPSPGPRGSSRLISETLSKRANETAESPIPHSDFAIFFGQFLNHDLENNRFVNASSRAYFPLVDYVTNVNDVTCDPVAFPAAGYRCNPTNTVLTSEARFSGGVFDSQGRISVYNNATGYFDLSQVYGSGEVHQAIRSFTGGKLTTANHTMTLTVSGVARTFTIEEGLATWAMTGITSNLDPILVQLSSPTWVFTQGDGRVNENLSLGLMHLIWTREHNLNAEAVRARHPYWDPVTHDQEIFNLARAITIAKYQKIIYTEYFPNEFGAPFAAKLGNYKGYNLFTNANTMSAFAAIAFRYGHVALNAFSPRDSCGVKSQYNVPNNASMPFLGQTAVGLPSMSPLGVIAVAGGFENVVRGLVSQKSAPISLGAAVELRNTRLTQGVVDLISLDIMRARYNQVPNYQKLRSSWQEGHHSIRNIYGKDECPHSLKESESDDPLECFEVITGTGSPLAVQLKDLYKKVLHIDPIIGAFAEPKVPGSSFGETLGNIITEQYRRSRDGDRFFYERLLRNGYFSPSAAEEIRGATMAGVLRRVFPGIVVPSNPWMVDETYVDTLAATCA